MSVNVTTAFVQQYKSNLQQLLQQKGSRLRQAVIVEQCYGKAAKAIEQVGAVAATELTVRHGDTPQTDTPHSARWIHPRDFVVNDYIDDQDKLRMLVDPQSIYSKNKADSLGRAIDNVIISSALGTNYVGENGTTTEAFNTTDWEIGAAATGLTTAKVRDAMLRLKTAENDPDEEYYLVARAKDIDNLIGEGAIVQSVDFNTGRPMMTGGLPRYFGFNIIQSERLLTSGANTRVLAFPKSGLMLGLWSDIQVRIDERPDKNYATQVYARATFGACRTHENPDATKGKVVSILCVT